MGAGGPPNRNLGQREKFCITIEMYRKSMQSVLKRAFHIFLNKNQHQFKMEEDFMF
jgi:hypothetical protein